MYLASNVWEQGLHVWVEQGPMSATDWDQAFDGMRQLIAWSPKLSVRPAVILWLIDMPRPDPVRRKQIAEFSGHPAYNPYLAVVNSSALIRGVFTALRWLQADPQYEATTHAAPDGALKWLEEKRGTPLPLLRRMAADIQRKLEDPAQLSTR